jgi:sugar-specific transcriptional regulator TrmB
MVVNIVSMLMEAGFSEYESRSYIGLLKKYPATAYEIAKSSGIPTSKIYEVLTRLKEKGVVLEAENEGHKKYVPLSPDDFIARVKGKIDTTLSMLNEELSGIATETEISYIWNIDSYDRLIERARFIISSAKSNLLVSAWEKELAAVSDALKKQEKKKIKIAVVLFGEPSTQVGQLFLHPIEDTIYNEKGGRGFTLVADSNEVLIGTIYPNDSVSGAWSRNRGFVTIAEDYVKHDIYIMKIVERFDQTLIRRFGEKYHKLRDIFSDEEVKK